MSRSYKRPVDSPSFSSSLLDKVFRSIDEPEAPPNSQPTRSISSDRLAAHQSISQSQHKPTKIGPSRRKFDTDSADAKPGRNRRNDYASHNGPVSASHDHKPKPDVLAGVQNLKPIRTSTAKTERHEYQHPGSTSTKMNRNLPKHKEEFTTLSPSSSLQNAKIRAQKMYGDLKEVKQPISPGGRFTRFITSLFTKRYSNLNSKSEKLCETEAVRTRNVPVTTCYSASSYYRSCLRNKPPASSKNSVRFCPVNSVNDDQYRDNPRLVQSTKSLVGQESNGKIKQRQTQSNLKELLKKYDKKVVLSVYDDKLSDEDRDDVGSCASSDLFELDHIGGNVNSSIKDELPVFETTEFHIKNPAICFGESGKITSNC